MTRIALFSEADGKVIAERIGKVITNRRKNINGRRRVGKGNRLKFGKCDVDINFGDEDVTINLWDDTQNPVVAFDPPRTLQCRYVWLSQEKISAGKMLKVERMGPFWHISDAECEDPPPAQLLSAASTLSPESGQQINLDGANAPYTVNMPPGADTRFPTGIRNVSQTAQRVTFNPAPSEFFWFPLEATQLNTIDINIGIGDDAMFVYQQGLGWVSYGPSLTNTGVNVYSLAGIVAPALPGQTIRIPLQAALGTGTDDFTIFGGDQLQAVHPLIVRFEVALDTEYIASGNNQEIGVSCDVVATNGTPTILSVPMKDSFSTPRAGSFGKNHLMPVGSISMDTGDRIAFDLINDGISTMNLELSDCLISIQP